MLINFRIPKGRKLRDFMSYIYSDSFTLNHKRSSLHLPFICTFKISGPLLFLRWIWLYFHIPRHECLLSERYARLHFPINKLIATLKTRKLSVITSLLYLYICVTFSPCKQKMYLHTTVSI